MKKSATMVVALGLLLSVTVLGCGQPKAANPKEAIANSKQYESKEKQVDYLVSQANKFLNDKEYAEAMRIANYVLSNLDKTSQEAKMIIVIAKQDLAEAAEAKIKKIKK